MQVRRQKNRALFANLHLLNHNVKAWNHLAAGGGELQGAATGRLVKDASVKQKSLVVDGNVLSAAAYVTLAFFCNFVVNAVLVLFAARPLFLDQLDLAFVLLGLGFARLFNGGLVQGVKVGLACLKGFGVASLADNRNLFNHVALQGLVNDILAADNLSKNRVLSVKPSCRSDSDKELASIRSRSRVGHGQNALLFKSVFAYNLVGESVARTAASGSFGVSALNHKVLVVAVGLADYAVEFKSVVKRLSLGGVHRSFGQADKVCDSQRRVLVKKFKGNLSLGQFKNGKNAFLSFQCVHSLFLHLVVLGAAGSEQHRSNQSREQISFIQNFHFA